MIGLGKRSGRLWFGLAVKGETEMSVRIVREESQVVSWEVEMLRRWRIMNSRKTGGKEEIEERKMKKGR